MLIRHFLLEFALGFVSHVMGYPVYLGNSTWLAIMNYGDKMELGLYESPISMNLFLHKLNY